MAKDYIPVNDDTFSAWATNFINTANEELASIHLTTTDMTHLATLASTFTDRLSVFRNMQNSFHSATADKDDARKAFEDDIRVLVRRIQGYSDVTAGMKIALGINPRDSGRSHTAPAPPMNLVANGLDSGINELFWERNANKPNTVFVVEARIGTAPDFVQVGTGTTTRFKHTGQTPGVKVIYRVFAQRDNETSLPSNTATLYDTATGTPALELVKAA